MTALSSKVLVLILFIHTIRGQEVKDDCKYEILGERFDLNPLQTTVGYTLKLNL